MSVHDSGPAGRRRRPTVRGVAVAITTYVVIMALFVALGVDVDVGELLLVVVVALVLGGRAAYRARRPARR